MPRHLIEKQKRLLDEHRYAKQPGDLPQKIWNNLEQMNDFETIHSHVSDYLCRHYDPEAVELKEWYLMPSINECLAEYEKQDIGLIADIAKHGCSGGVAGITYYSETIAFHDHHQEEIWQLVQDHADAAGLKNGEFLQHISQDPTSLTGLVNDLVWWAVKVRAQELHELVPRVAHPFAEATAGVKDCAGNSDGKARSRLK